MERYHQSFPTVAEALAAVAGWDDLALPRRKSLSTALRTYCRLGGKRAPETLRLDPARCLPEMDAAAPVALGISEQTLRNVRAGLRSVLRRLNLLAPVYRREAVSDPQWAGLIACLPSRFHPHRLRAFMEWCSGEGIAPDAVTPGALSDYLAHRVQARGGDNNRADVGEVARQWNKTGQVVEGWPPFQIALPPNEARPRALAFEAYPASLQEEVEHFLAWCVKDPEEDPYAEGAREPLSAATAEGRKKAIRLLLWGLVETGTAPESLTDIKVLIQVDTAKRTLLWHRRRLGGKPTGGLGLMADTLQTLAAHFGLKGLERDNLNRVLKVSRPKRQTEITQRTADLLDRLTDPLVRARLFSLPARLMREARRDRDGWTSEKGVNHPPKPVDACWVAALAVAVEIELRLPLRLQDLTCLKIDQELRITQTGRQRAQAHLRVVTSKTGAVVETLFPEKVVALLQEYLVEFRPLGPHPETSWLFPHRDSHERPRSKGGFGAAIAEVIEKHTGVRLNVHGFRALVACLILEDDPNAIEDVRAMLGHSYYDMINRHYARSGRRGAAERTSALICKEQSKGRLTESAARLPRRLPVRLPNRRTRRSS